MKNLIITLLLFTSANSCTNKYREKTSEPINFEFAIIKPTVDERQFIAQDFSETWIPDTTDLIIIEQLIMDAVQKNKTDLLTRASLPNYYRQYVGFLNATGERMVWVNALCEIKEGMVEKNGEFFLEPWQWKEELIIVEDGGHCFWNILINLDKYEYFQFFINGVAFAPENKRYKMMFARC